MLWFNSLLLLCRKHRETSFRASRRRVEKSVFNRFLHFAMLGIASVEMTYGLFYRALILNSPFSILNSSAISIVFSYFRLLWHRPPPSPDFAVYSIWEPGARKLLYFTFLACSSNIILWAKFSVRRTSHDADSISPSSSNTPGSTGNVGKWSAKYSSAKETLFMAFICLPFSSEITLSISINLIHRFHRFFHPRITQIPRIYIFVF